MPKIFEYLGILIFFYSNEHEPIHVHAKKGEFESKAEIYILEGEIDEVKWIDPKELAQYFTTDLAPGVARYLNIAKK